MRSFGSMIWGADAWMHERLGIEEGILVDEFVTGSPSQCILPFESYDSFGVTD